MKNQNGYTITEILSLLLVCGFVGLVVFLFSKCTFFAF